MQQNILQHTVIIKNTKANKYIKNIYIYNIINIIN